MAEKFVLATHNPGKLREMGEILNLTTRSAARILSQLADAGSAVTANKRGMSQRGRPVKYYRLDLEALG